jgi:hypothetical protein
MVEANPVPDSRSDQAGARRKSTDLLQWAAESVEGCEFGDTDRINAF